MKLNVVLYVLIVVLFVQVGEAIHHDDNLINHQFDGRVYEAEASLPEPVAIIAPSKYRSRTISLYEDYAKATKHGEWVYVKPTDGVWSR